MDAYYEREPFTTTVSFFFLYVIITGLSLPGAAILTLAAGAIFGVLWGTIVVSFASTIGATLAFLFSRYLFREAIPGTFCRQVDCHQQGDGRGRRVLPVHPAPGAHIPVLHHQPGDGSDYHQGIDLLSRQPGRDAGRDHRVRERGYTNRQNRATQGYCITGIDPVFRTAGHLPAVGEKDGGLPEKTKNPQMTHPCLKHAGAWINADFFGMISNCIGHSCTSSSFPRRRESSRQTVAFQATLYHQDLRT